MLRGRRSTPVAHARSLSYDVDDDALLAKHEDTAIASRWGPNGPVLAGEVPLHLEATVGPWLAAVHCDLHQCGRELIEAAFKAAHAIIDGTPVHLDRQEPVFLTGGSRTRPLGPLPILELPGVRRADRGPLPWSWTIGDRRIAHVRRVGHLNVEAFVAPDLGLSTAQIKESLDGLTTVAAASELAQAIAMHLLSLAFGYLGHRPSEQDRPAPYRA